VAGRSARFRHNTGVGARCGSSCNPSCSRSAAMRASPLALEAGNESLQFSGVRGAGSGCHLSVKSNRKTFSRETNRARSLFCRSEPARGQHQIGGSPCVGDQMRRFWFLPATGRSPPMEGRPRSGSEVCRKPPQMIERERRSGRDRGAEKLPARFSSSAPFGVLEAGSSRRIWPD
jgi:hypothetical protein